MELHEIEREMRIYIWVAYLTSKEMMSIEDMISSKKMRFMVEERREALRRVGYDAARLERVRAVHEGAKGRLAELGKLHPLWPRVRPIRGFGPYLTAAFVAVAGDVRRANTVSQFWSGMGLGLRNGVVPRRRRGSRGSPSLPAHPIVLWTNGLIRQRLMLAKGRFFELYERFKRAEPEDKPKILRHKSALRKAHKVLYACLWKELRHIHGLPAPEPYAFAVLGHDPGGMMEIEDFWDVEVGGGTG